MTGVGFTCACKQCTEKDGRHPGCHGTCEKYKKFRDALDEENINRRIEAQKALWFYKKTRRYKK